MSWLIRNSSPGILQYRQERLSVCVCGSYCDLKSGYAVALHLHSGVTVENLSCHLVDECSLPDKEIWLNNFLTTDKLSLTDLILTTTPICSCSAYFPYLTFNPYLKILIHFSQESQLSMVLRLTRNPPKT